ncbi:hypothetical protein [Legionella saoudiensis]|uniref:hypothetical protein n=1 Tax=Legionella saoudiensis TaxID=1750561 RepID=UPI000730C5CE|nr:hypothetical protein [Legionella saoudiensis]
MLARLFGAVRGPELPAKKPMALIAPFNAGRLPANEMVQFREAVNALINQYNKDIPDLEKKEILKQIQDKMQEVEYKYNPRHFARSPGYQEMHAALFNEIKYQYASLGTPSLIKEPKNSSPLSEVIANMAPDKADKLMSILIKGKSPFLTAELNGLYDTEDFSTEAINFRKFLRDHEVSYLGGGNSKNFKVVNRDNGNEAVLKIDCRLDMPRNVEAHLREKIPGSFAPIAAERQVCGYDAEGEFVSRTMLVTDFCKGGSVNEHRNTLLTEQELQKSTGKIFEQMTSTLLDIQEARCMFPDAKITNWLVDANGKVQLADTKSFLFTDEKQQYKEGALPGNKYCSMLRTGGFMPPELDDSSVSADAVHAYILGKNLYYYASGRIGKGDDAADFRFDGPGFSGPMGKEYREIVEGLVKPDPSERMKVREALDRLFMVNNPEFKSVFTELKALKFGENDEKMNEFIRNKQQQINNAAPEDRPAILAELQQTVAALKADKAAQGVRSAIEDLRDRAGIFTVGMNAKAARIESAMSKLSIEDRCQFLTSGKSEPVMQALASHRHWGKGGQVNLTQDGKVDTEKAAQSFKDFKAKFVDQVGEAKAPKEEAPVQEKAQGMKL